MPRNSCRMSSCAWRAVIEHQAVAEDEVRPAERPSLPVIGVPADQHPLDLIGMREQVHRPVKHRQSYDIAVPFSCPHAGSERVAC
jgi:hypothetical protein